MSVLLHLSKTPCTNFTKFELHFLTVAMAWSCPDKMLYIINFRFYGYLVQAAMYGSPKAGLDNHT